MWILVHFSTSININQIGLDATYANLQVGVTVFLHNTAVALVEVCALLAHLVLACEQGCFELFYVLSCRRWET